MVSNKVALGLFLSFSLAMGYQTIKQTDIEIESKTKNPVIERLSDNSKIVLAENDLDSMIDEAIYTHPQFTSINFKNLKPTKLIMEEKWVPTYNNDHNKVYKIQKMQKLANYISTTYNIPIGNAQKIVYATFEESRKKNLEPTLVLSLIDNESSFKQHVKSPVGAVGLTQVMPKYHKAKIAELKRVDGTDIFSINGNIKVGTQILSEYIHMADGNLQKGLQMYNGSSKDSKRKYSSKIMATMKIYSKI